jgi:RimJ/RimL family protein N-acetyltransferase
MIFKIEKLSLKHSKFLFKLRNDIDIRKNSYNTDIIKFSTHTDWLKKLIKKKNIGYVFKSKTGSNIGYVRLNNKNSKDYVSIALSNKFRNKGLSKEILLAAENKFKSENLYSLVNKNNKKSISLFHSLDYIKINIQKDFILMKKKEPKTDYYLSIINKIEKIRKNNNSNWMGILKLCFKHSPKEAAKLMSNIYKDDSKISKLSKKLSK